PVDSSAVAHEDCTGLGAGLARLCVDTNTSTLFKAHCCVNVMSRAGYSVLVPLASGFFLRRTTGDYRSKWKNETGMRSRLHTGHIRATVSVSVEMTVFLLRWPNPRPSWQ